MRGRIIPSALSGVALVFGVLGNAQASLITNGSFESGPDVSASPYFAVISASSSAIPGWTISAGNVDYVGAGHWQPSHGSHSLDLNGDTTGAIQQTFSTIAGTLYEVSFDFAGNPNDPVDDLKTVRASISGIVSHELTFDTSGTSNADMGWIQQSFQFVAAASSSTLVFQSLETTGSPLWWGPAIDNVSVNAVENVIPGPTPLLLAGTGLLMLAGFKRAPRSKG